MGMGGALALFDAKTLIMMHCSFTNNAGMQGGALWSSTMAWVLITISGCLFENNTSAQGGAIFSGKSNLEFAVKNCMFRSNTANGIGGALFANSSAFAISNSEFSENHSPTGGAIFFYGAQKLHVTQSNFFKTNCDSNILSSKGGAIVADNSATVLLIFATVYENMMGGGLSLLRASAEISNSYFYNNSGSNGGAIDASQKSSVLIIRNTSFVGNTGSIGSTLYLGNPRTLIENCSFVGGVSYVMPLISVISKVRTDLRILYSVFIMPKETSYQLEMEKPSALGFSSLDEQSIPVTLYVWKTMYKSTTERVTQVDDNLIHNASMHFALVGTDVNFTSEVSPFASGKSFISCVSLQLTQR